MNKDANTDKDILQIIKERWSPRAFSDQMISKEDLETIFEAARWAPSSRNAQPWRYFYALRGSEGFKKLHSALLAGNQPWTENASVLIVACSKTNFNYKNLPNRTAQHDLGLANAQLVLQAQSMNIYSHMMAGYEEDDLEDILNLPIDTIPVCMIALGYMGDVDSLEEPLLSREKEERTRSSQEVIATEVI